MWPCGARSAPNFFRKHIMHSVLGRSGGMLLYKFRRYESASEAVGDHHNHAKMLDCNSGDSSYGGNHFPFGISLCIYICETRPQNCPTELQILEFYACRT